MTSDAGPSAGADVAFGIDIGGTKVLGVALGPSERVLVEARVATPIGLSQGDVVGRGVAVAVAEAVAEVVARLDAAMDVGSSSASEAPAIGVGVPGMLDRAGRLRFSPNLPQGQGVDWHVLLSEPLPQRRILIENDANLAALAELRVGRGEGI